MAGPQELLGAIMRLKPGVTFFQLVPLDFNGLTAE